VRSAASLISEAGMLVDSSTADQRSDDCVNASCSLKGGEKYLEAVSGYLY
jgi:hypothetical protein